MFITFAPLQNDQTVLLTPQSGLRLMSCPLKDLFVMCGNSSQPPAPLFGWWVVLHLPTCDLNRGAPLFQENSSNRWRVTQKPGEINDPCCYNEKDSFFRVHPFILLWWGHGWIGSALCTSKDREINIMPRAFSAVSLLVGLPGEKQLFHSGVPTARHVLFQIKPSRSQSHLFVSKRTQNGILRNNNKFTVDVRNHNKFSAS